METKIRNWILLLVGVLIFIGIVLATTTITETSILTGNITADYFFGDGSQLTGLNNYYPKMINLTSETYNGSLVNETKVGYNAGNLICNTEFTGSHLCDEFEVMQWFANAIPTIDDDAWVSAGSPKYIPATVPVNDCNGWTYAGTTDYLGNYWHFNSTTGGDARALNCGSALHLACCTY